MTNLSSKKKKQKAQAKVSPTRHTRTKPKKSIAKRKKTPQASSKATPRPSVVQHPSAAADTLPAGSSLSHAEELLLLAGTPPEARPPLLHPSQAANCRFAFDIIDEFTGVQKRGLRPRLLFTYTPEQYRKFIPTGDFIRCEGFLSQSSTGSMALNLDIYVASPVAQQKLGRIPPNASLLLHTIDGQEYHLVTYQGAQPKLVDQITQYQCSFAINKRDLKGLHKAEVDQVRLRFAEGTQTYEVYYLDFLRDQFHCFDAPK